MGGAYIGYMGQRAPGSGRSAHQAVHLSSRFVGWLRLSYVLLWRTIVAVWLNETSIFPRGILTNLRIKMLKKEFG
ncbi:hypothetical protein E2C01_042802 [Portunus trituberculatus]|uniref:Uncharacterized protein n=1 Tax=Portunus trituberculatus TaxID=210409 RepID=A0A5B7FXH6_PORTR|nr:hypothetical protein [Portunus trituberculatus]